MGFLLVFLLLYIYIYKDNENNLCITPVLSNRTRRFCTGADTYCRSIGCICDGTIAAHGTSTTCATAATSVVVVVVVVDGDVVVG